jgi:hypothetical protein
VIGAAPLTPFSRFFHVSSAELPNGVTAPIPVTTTLFNSIKTKKEDNKLGVRNFSKQ